MRRVGQSVPLAPQNESAKITSQLGSLDKERQGRLAVRLRSTEFKEDRTTTKGRWKIQIVSLCRFVDVSQQRSEIPKVLQGIPDCFS